ncbi:MAG: efflux RND transporter periplasmic adaptor subunit [Deltaproteobacteria bacterium]|nr:efflux RND transporter periplasmic adaptor subunit [Deltaproteobacteria bacterium]
MIGRNGLRVLWSAGILLMFGITLFSIGCKKNQAKEGFSKIIVEVAPVLLKDVPIHSEWTASTDGFVNATIRAQVQGYLVEQDYKEGDFVLKGQVLFKIDPRFLQATLDQARGQLTEQRARWENARANLERIKPLVAQKAVSQKDFDEAVATERVTLAAVVAAQAVVDKAQVDLGFTRIISPIDGIAGIARAQLGNLVGPGSIEELTTVSTVDPIKVYFPMSEQEYLKYMANGNGKTQQIPLELILADGNVHPFQGKLAFADRQVDLRTGTIKVAALFKNPGNVLRPGQFARIRARIMVKKGALLVPQRAVIELQGKYQAAVVGPDNKVSIRQVKAAERVGNLWVIEEGLNPGEQVVIEGLQKIKDGMVVATRPFRSDSGMANTAGPQPAIQKTGKK